MTGDRRRQALAAMTGSQSQAAVGSRCVDSDLVRTAKYLSRGDGLVGRVPEKKSLPLPAGTGAPGW